MLNYRNFSLSQKLALLVLASTASAVLISSIAVVAFETQESRKFLLQQLGITADMLAKHSTAALAFHDTRAADRTLSSLLSRSSVVSAVIRDMNGKVVAQYLRDDATENDLPQDTTAGKAHFFADDHFQVNRMIYNNSGELGSIAIRSDLVELQTVAFQFKLIAAIIAISSCLIAVLLSTRLQRSISLPILSLASVAGRIRHEADFSLRAEKNYDDETGELVAAFNAMLDNIQQRDRDLAQYRNELEELVDRRTRQLERSQEKLRHSERLASVGTLAAGIAHQINNPIGTILNAAQFALLCENDEDFKEVWKQALTRNADEAVRCGRIVRSVLQFSRNDATERWPNDLVSVCRKACTLADTYAREHFALIDFHYPEVPVTVLMSPIQMEQALVNLMQNAMESLADHGGCVELHLEADEKFARIEIRDNGSGISDEDMGRIFDPFFTTRLMSGGTGLGLSMVHGIIANHGGRIEAESEMGIGSLFIIQLPIHDQQA